MWRRDGFAISTDPAHFDPDLIWRYLRDESYWANGIPRDLFERSLERSLSFGLFAGEPGNGGAQIGFGHPDLQEQRGFVLATRDAHGPYATFGWKPGAGRFMRITRPYRMAQ